MPHCVPLKVRIGLKVENGRRVHNYPPFNDLESTLRDNMDWSHFVDFYGGWHYDQTSGHNDNDDDSPRGEWQGMILVPKAFAEAAADRWPDQCEVLAEASAASFYETRAHVRDPDIHENTDVLQGIAAKRSAGLEEDDDDKSSLDPDHPKPGRQRNKTKSWDGFLKQSGISIDAG